MKKQEKFKLNSLTDIKVFLLFVMDNLRYPIDYTTLTKIISDNVSELTFDYEDCLRELADEEHLLFDEIDGERYYMISESGKFIAAELCDRLDSEFREAAIRSCAKYVSLSKADATVRTDVVELADKRYQVTLEAEDRSAKLMALTITVASRAEAEKIADGFRKNPDTVYRGVLFCLTGRVGFLS